MEEQVNTQGSLPKFVMPTVVAALIVFAVIGYYFYNSGSNNSSQPASTMEGQGSPAAVSESDSNYKNGTYTVNGGYVSPGGPIEIGVTLTLTDGLVTAAESQVLAEDATSKRFQTEFVEGFKPMVIGKSLNEVVLSKVSGSSLTPKGFNDAVEKIKVEAQS